MELFPPLGEETRLPLPQEVSQIHVNFILKYLKQPLPPPQHKIVVANYTLNHKLAIQIGRWSTIPSLEITCYATFALLM